MDDESAQRRVFHRLFETHGFEARTAPSALEALRIAQDPATRPDFVLSDIAMPGMDGVAFIKFLRAAPETAAIPALLMTGWPLPLGMLELAAETLDAGPVFIKGGEFPSLIARVTERLRSPAPHKGGVVIDAVKRTVTIDGFRLPELPARRFQLLCALLSRPEVIGREELLRQVWFGSDNPNIVDVTIMRLREDLKHLPFLSIFTAPSGYRLVVGPPPPPTH